MTGSMGRVGAAGDNAGAAGVAFVEVDPAYSSQTCHKCGWVDKRNRRSQAGFECVRVLVVIKYSDDADAVAIANDTEYGLSAGVWSTNNERALGIARQLESGIVWITDWHMVNAMYPFGGMQQSGIGRELGPDALDECVEPKFVHLDMTNHWARRAYAVVVSAAARGSRPCRLGDSDTQTIGLAKDFIDRWGRHGRFLARLVGVPAAPRACGHTAGGIFSAWRSCCMPLR
jgi:Aldehyde dehydrogenase family/Putative transposase DNA-binding domain